MRNVEDGKNVDNEYDCGDYFEDGKNDDYDYDCGDSGGWQN